MDWSRATVLNGLDSMGLHWMGLHWMGLHYIGLDCMGRPGARE